MPHPFSYHRTIVGYHGCDISVLEGVLLHDKPMKPSENDFDWLGNGIYFWENGPERALKYAERKMKREGHKSSIKTPSVLGAYIHLGRCFDLTDLWATTELRRQYKVLVNVLDEAGKPMPENKGGFPGDPDAVKRFLDCFVVEAAVRHYNRENPDLMLQTVRGVFPEGDPTYPGAGFHMKTHAQIAVRDPACIVGFFKPKVDPGITVKG